MHLLMVIFVVMVVVIGFGYIAYQSEAEPQKVFSDDVRNVAKALTTNFPDGANVQFALDPQPPVTEFVYKDVQVVREVEQPDGTIKNETVTEKVKLETSSGEFVKTDSRKKICNIGYNCPIEGSITLVDIKGNEVIPPYGFFLQISCENTYEWCNHDRTVMVNELTDSNGGFRYNWYTSQTRDHIGSYEATVHVRSAYDVNGQKFTYDVIPLQIELIE